MPIPLQLFQNQYIFALIILVGTVLASEIFHYTFRNYIKRIAAVTKTEVDDKLLDAVTKPLHFLILTVGAFLAAKSLNVAVAYLPTINGIFFLLVVFLLSFMLIKVMDVFIPHWLRVQKRYEKTPRLVNRFITVVIYALAALVVLNHFDVEITPLLATLGIGGLAVGLALQNTLSNFFAGLHIISDRPVKVGDHIKLENGPSGHVEDIGWRSTRIRTLPNMIVIIPNSKLAESIITNTSLPEAEISAVVQCGVGYGSDLEKVERVTVEVARHIQKTVPGAIASFEPFIRYHTFGDSNINFSVILRVEKYVSQYLVTHEFIKALKARYDKEGIEISWPVRKVYQAKEKA